VAELLVIYQIFPTVLRGSRTVVSLIRLQRGVEGWTATNLRNTMLIINVYQLLSDFRCRVESRGQI